MSMYEYVRYLSYKLRGLGETSSHTHTHTLRSQFRSLEPPLAAYFEPT